MSLEKLKNVSEQILGRSPSLKGRGEEATKQALILPMLDALGYDIWNPTEVCPEYEADFAIKKAGQKEKVDLAITLNGIPKIYFEVKSVETNLDGHEGQLARYFNSTKTVTLGILTNGVEWRFFTDTGDPNVMDNLPFHIAKFEAADQGLDVMSRFGKTVFSPEAIRDYATELKYTASIANFLREELDLKDRDPSENLIRWILKSEKMYDGIVNANVVDRFRPIAKAAITRVIREIVRRSLSAMEVEAANTPTLQSTLQDNRQEKIQTEIESTDSIKPIQTTEKELKCFELAKAIFDSSEFSKMTIYDATIRKDVPIEFSYKDTTGYFGLYVNKPAWWIARIVIEAKKPWIGFQLEKSVAEQLLPEGFTMLDSGAFAEARIGISAPEDLQHFTKLFAAAISKLINERKIHE